MKSFFRRNKRLQEYVRSKCSTENLIRNVEEFRTIFSVFEDTDIIHGKTGILLNNNRLDSIDLYSLEKKFGKRKYRLSLKSGMPKHSVHFIEIGSAPYKFSVQLHFTDEHFFFASSRLASEASLLEKDKQIIIESIRENYCPDGQCQENEFAVKDMDGNIISVVDDVNFYINYIPNVPGSQKLRDQFLKNSEQKRRMELKESLRSFL